MKACRRGGAARLFVGRVCGSNAAGGGVGELVYHFVPAVAGMALGPAPGDTAGGLVTGDGGEQQLPEVLVLYGFLASPFANRAAASR